MAVRDLHDGKFYVWLKNIGGEPIHVNPNHFTLVTNSLHSVHYNESEGIMVELQPGTVTEGRIGFKTSSGPKELIYSHPTSGRISKEFP